MAHFAQIDDNGLVLNVIVVNDENCLDDDGNENESVGVNFIVNNLKMPGIWKQTSYNTYAGKHYVDKTLPLDSANESANQSKALRDNYAETGGTYNSELNVFIPPKPHKGWVLVEGNIWKPPHLPPDIAEDGSFIEGLPEYKWDDDTLDWVEHTH